MVLTQRYTLGHLLKYEESGHRFSRDKVTLASGSNASGTVTPLGTVLGIITASGKAVPLAPAAIDGSQTAIGVLEQDTDASAADTNTTIIDRVAIVADYALVWPGGISGPQKLAAIAQLAALEILVRTGV
jgi:Bacteriophage lambda head decoration protein D